MNQIKMYDFIVKKLGRSDFLIKDLLGLYLIEYKIYREHKDWENTDELRDFVYEVFGYMFTFDKKTKTWNYGTLDIESPRCIWKDDTYCWTTLEEWLEICKLREYNEEETEKHIKREVYERLKDV